MTFFGRRIEAVNAFDMAAQKLSLVDQLSGELAPAGILDALGQTVIANHTLHVQILDFDVPVRTDQAMTQLVQKFCPMVAYLLVGFGQPQPGLVPVLTALLFPRKRTMQTLDFLFSPTIIVRMV